MTDLSCAEARELAPEYALGILDQDDRAPLAAHILRCLECRQEVDELGRLSEDLLELIPAAGPSLGFDRRVLSATRPPRRRRRSRIIAGVAAVAAAAALVAGLTLTGGTGGPHEVRAPLVADGHVVGSVYTEGRPPWVWMAVRNGARSGPVTCQLVRADGSIVDLGSFDLVDGSGSWAAPEPAGMDHIEAARLVAADGQVVAQATFRS